MAGLSTRPTMRPGAITPLSGPITSLTLMVQPALYFLLLHTCSPSTLWMVFLHWWRLIITYRWLEASGVPSTATKLYKIWLFLKVCLRRHPVVTHSLCCAAVQGLVWCGVVLCCAAIQSLVWWCVVCWDWLLGPSPPGEEGMVCQ